MFGRDLWNLNFSDWPTWPCPTCGSVAVSKQKDKAKLLVDETGPSKDAHSHEAWEPEWVTKRFAAVLQCHNPACGELVAIIGNVALEEGIDEDPDGSWSRTYGDTFEPTGFVPAPPIFVIPNQCPATVSKQLHAAFSLIWQDVGAAANRLRAGVEALLDDRKVPKTTRAGARRKNLTAHDRILRFSAADAEAAQLLMAIKWLGNTGSHGASDALSRSDLLDGMTLFEGAIDRVYVKSAEKYASLAAAISKRKGKPEKAKKRKKKKKAKSP